MMWWSQTSKIAIPRFLSTGPGQDAADHLGVVRPAQAVALLGPGGRAEGRRGDSVLAPGAVGQRDQEVVLLQAPLHRGVYPFRSLGCGRGGFALRSSAGTGALPCLLPAPPQTNTTTTTTIKQQVDSQLGKATGKGDAAEQIKTFVTSSPAVCPLLIISYETCVAS